MQVRGVSSFHFGLPGSPQPRTWTCPQMKMLALVQRPEEVSPLEASGVEVVLMQGVSTGKLTETILALLDSADEPAT